MKQFRFVWFVDSKKYEGDWYNTSDYTLADMQFNDEDMAGYSNWFIEYRG